MDEPNFYCLCRSIHVLTGARWIGIVGTLACTAGLVCSLVFGQSLVGILLSLLTAPFYISLLYAHYQNRPHLYLPFLVANGMEMCLNALYICFVLAMLIWMPKFWQRHLDISLEAGLDKTGKRQFTGLLLATLVLLECFLYWFQSIVLHAHKYMCQEQNTLIPPAFPSTKSNKDKLNRMERESQLA